jgi:hypothetical protein
MDRDDNREIWVVETNFSARQFFVRQPEKKRIGCQDIAVGANFHSGRLENFAEK